MTDHTAQPAAEGDPEKWDPATDPDGYTREDVSPKDFLLDVLLDSTLGTREDGGGSFSLTVTLGGQVVSGTAISRGEWMDSVASQYDQAGGGDFIRKAFDMVQGQIVEEQERREAADLPTGARGFLHMRDVRVGNGGGWADLRYWRGSLSDVTGWSLGSWSPGSTPAGQ